MDAPTADELLQVPKVLDAIEQAWADSLPDDPAGRHEEGGWIYLNPTTGEYKVERAARGEEAAIDLYDPPVFDDYFVVGKFHTHPNPTADGWNPGPSPSDEATDDIHGVPDLIRADNGVYYSGPTSRRDGLSGDPGYPR